mgnify:CR=1 FL=1
MSRAIWFLLSIGILTAGCYASGVGDEDGAIADGDSDSDSDSDSDTDSDSDSDSDLDSDSDSDADGDLDIDIDSDFDSDPPGQCGYGGALYSVDESFPALDGCNTCTCVASARGGRQVVCTDMACGDHCAGIDENTCSQMNSCLPVYGAPIVQNAGCVMPPQFTHCMDAAMGCDPVVQVVPDANGTCWFFGSSCTPPDWPQYQYLFTEPGAPPVPPCQEYLNALWDLVPCLGPIE